MTLDQEIAGARLKASAEWVEKHYRPTQNSIDLVCSSQQVLAISTKHSKHTAFYMLPQYPELVKKVKEQLKEGGYPFVEYASIEDKTLTTATKQVSFSTGTVLEPPFKPNTFDHAYIDLEMATLTDLDGGFSWRAPWWKPLLTLAEYVHRLKPEGHLFVRAPVAHRAFLDGVAAAFAGMVDQYRLGKTDNRTAIKFPLPGSNRQVYDLMLDIRKTGAVNPAVIRSEVKALNGQVAFPTVPENVVLVTMDTIGLKRLPYHQ